MGFNPHLLVRMCLQRFTHYACGHVNIKEQRCDTMRDLASPFTPHADCKDYERSEDHLTSPCGLGGFYCKHTEDGAFLEDIHQQIDQIQQELRRVHGMRAQYQQLWAQFHQSADQAGVPKDVRQQHPKFHRMCTQVADLKNRHRELVQMRQRSLATTHNAFDFYKKRVTNLPATGLPLTAPTNDYLSTLREARAKQAVAPQPLQVRHPAVPVNAFGAQQVVPPPPGPAGDNIFVSHLRTSFSAQHNPLQDPNLLQGSNGSKHVRQQASEGGDEDTEVWSPPKKKTRAKGKGKAVDRLASTSMESEDSSIRRSTRARSKQVSYAESEGSSILSREPSPSKSESSNFAPNGSEPSSSPEKAYEITRATSKRPRPSTIAEHIAMPLPGQTLRSTIGDWKRRSEASEQSSSDTPRQQQKPRLDGFVGTEIPLYVPPDFTKQSPLSRTLSTAAANLNQRLPHAPQVSSNLRSDVLSQSLAGQHAESPSQTAAPNPLRQAGHINSTPSLKPSASNVGKQKSVAASTADPRASFPQGLSKPSAGDSSYQALMGALQKLSSQRSAEFSGGISEAQLPSDSQAHRNETASVNASRNSNSSPGAQWTLNDPAVGTQAPVADMQSRDPCQMMSISALITSTPSTQGPTVGNAHSVKSPFSTPRGPYESPLLTQMANMSGIDRIVTQNSGFYPNEASDAATSTDYQSLRRSLGSNPDLRTPQVSSSTTPFNSDPRKRPLPASSPDPRPAKQSRLSFPGEDGSSNIFDQYAQLSRHDSASAPSQEPFAFSQSGMAPVFSFLEERAPTPSRPFVFNAPRTDGHMEMYRTPGPRSLDEVAITVPSIDLTEDSPPAQQFTERYQGPDLESQDVIDLTAPSTVSGGEAPQTQQYTELSDQEFQRQGIEFAALSMDFIGGAPLTQQYAEMNQIEGLESQNLIDLAAPSTALMAEAPQIQQYTRMDLSQDWGRQGVVNLSNQEIVDLMASSTGFGVQAPPTQQYVESSHDQEPQSQEDALTATSTSFWDDALQTQQFSGVDYNQQLQSQQIPLTAPSTVFGSDGAGDTVVWEGLDPNEDWTWMDDFLRSVDGP